MGGVQSAQCPARPIIWLPRRERKFASPGLSCDPQKLKILRIEKVKLRKKSQWSYLLYYFS